MDKNESKGFLYPPICSREECDYGWREEILSNESDMNCIVYLAPCIGCVKCASQRVYEGFFGNRLLKVS